MRPQLLAKPAGHDRLDVPVEVGNQLVRLFVTGVTAARGEELDEPVPETDRQTRKRRWCDRNWRASSPWFQPYRRDHVHARVIGVDPYVQTAPGKRGPTSILASMTLSPTGVNAHRANGAAGGTPLTAAAEAKALTPLTAR